MIKRIIKYFYLFFIFLYSVKSWGPIGHESVAKIAQDNINTNTFNNINKYIPNGDMVNVSNWADHVRTLPAFKWSEPLHFIDTPSWTCNYIRERDCNDNMCVDGAIQNYTNRLYTIPETDDLKFLIHFVGDISQPLHCGFKNDRGGNSIHVHFNKKYMNLHAVWDSGIIEYIINTNYNGNWLEWVNYLENNYKSINLTCNPFNGDCSKSWGNSSANLACEYAYQLPDGTKIENGTTLTTEYINNAIEIINFQILNGGYRLSYVLNLIFENN
jgi:hypothetical protein